MDGIWSLEGSVPLVLGLGTGAGLVAGLVLWVVGGVCLLRRRAARNALCLGLALSVGGMAISRELGITATSLTLLAGLLAAAVAAVLLVRRLVTSPVARAAVAATALLVWDGLYLSEGGWTMLLLLLAFLARLSMAGGRGVLRQWAPARAQLGGALVWLVVGVAVAGFSRFNLRLSAERSRAVVAACRQFEEEHGRLPAGLPELVPTYLPHVPRADWTATGEFRYEQAGGGTLAYFSPWPRERVYAFGTGEWVWRRHLLPDPQDAGSRDRRESPEDEDARTAATPATRPTGTTTAGPIPCLVLRPARDRVRYDEYRRWATHYQAVMGLQEYKLLFQKRPHDKWCAWVKTDKTPPSPEPEPKTIYVGLGDPGPIGCEARTPRELAAHELCHVKLRHLWPPQNANSWVSHAEVQKCVTAWE